MWRERIPLLPVAGYTAMQMALASGEAGCSGRVRRTCGEYHESASKTISNCAGNLRLREKLLLCSPAPSVLVALSSVKTLKNKCMDPPKCAAPRDYELSTRLIYCLVAARRNETRTVYKFEILPNRPHAMAVRCLGRTISVLSLDRN
jgi:hypothetical protein